jgi:tRNA A-37 threonylcarbamoyl transferase component Bud32
MNEAFGKYEFVERIGVGGMAEVFRAKTFGPEGFVKEVVIKRILPAFSEDPDFVRMFINEARLAAKLQHTNIVQIFDFNHVDGVYYIAMEWVDGTDLKRVLNRSRTRSMPISTRAAIHVGVETLKGLHYAHNRAERGAPLNIVHRDISPHNLLLSLSGEVKIADFGIAKVAALASVTRSGMLKGKLAYMSPEQASNEPLDARSDIFSLGIVLWELLTGRRLYRGDSEAQLFARVKHAEIPPPRSINEAIPSELDPLIMKMLAPTPEGRFVSAAAALGELSRFAVVGAALEVAEYLGSLLPAEAGRDRKGETMQLTRGPEQIPVAAPDAPTRTRGARDQELVEEDARDAAAPAGPAATRQPAQLILDGEGAQGATPRWLIPTALLLFVAVAVVVWAVARTSTGRPIAAAPPLRVASVRVAAPVGADLLIDGVKAGQGPHKVSGAVGTRLHLVARSDAGISRKEVQIGVVERVALTLSSPPLGPTNNPADAGADLSGTVPDRSVRRMPRRTKTTKSIRATKAAKTTKTRLHTKVPPKRPATIKVTASGTLDILVSPWAKVKINGRSVGVTPLRRHSLPAGKYRLELRNDELNRVERLKIKIKPDKTATVRRTWD